MIARFTRQRDLLCDLYVLLVGLAAVVPVAEKEAMDPMPSGGAEV